MDLREECQLPESELLLADVGQVFLERQSALREAEK